MTGTQPAKAAAHEELAREHFDAKLRRDTATLTKQMTDDAVWWVPRSAGRLGRPRPIVGREPIVQMLTSVPLFRPDGRRWDIHHVVADDDVAFVHASLSAITRSGNTYENDYVFVFHFRDGLIDTVWEHLDTAYAYERFSQADPAN